MSSDAEAELDKFRREWKAEVSKNKSRATGQPKAHTGSSTAQSAHAKSAKRGLIPSSSAIASQDHDIEPNDFGTVYNGFGGKGHGRNVGEAEIEESSRGKEPRSALDHYEKAVEKETQGALGDSVGLYRTAFRLDSRVHEKYKQKHFPAAAFHPKAVSHPVPNSNPPAEQAAGPSPAAPVSSHLFSVTSIIDQFSSLRIEGQVAPTDADPAPPCPISKIPEELLVEILVWMGITDVAGLARLGQVCKRLAYLVATEDRVWKRAAEGPEFGFQAMPYRYTVSLEGALLTPPLSPISNSTIPKVLPSLPLIKEFPTYRQTFRSRPRIRFNGAYISTVNYTRPGASSPNALTWNSPVLIVTYYRYLRFFRDGSCISLLTTAEPADVVPYLQKEYLPAFGRKERIESMLPSAVMKDALRGRWKLSGNPYTNQSSYVDDDVAGSTQLEPEGDIHIETEGVTPKYLYKMQFAIGSTNRSAKNSRLAWKGYWSYNKLTDDWAEFGLKNDRAFWFSRVKSYGLGMHAGAVEFLEILADKTNRS